MMYQKMSKLVQRPGNSVRFSLITYLQMLTLVQNAKKASRFSYFLTAIGRYGSYPRPLRKCKIVRQSQQGIF